MGHQHERESPTGAGAEIPTAVTDPDEGRRYRRPPCMKRIYWLGLLFLIPLGWVWWLWHNPGLMAGGPFRPALIAFAPQFVVIGIIWFSHRAIRRRMQAKVRAVEGRICWRCMYDLSALEMQGVCPECGTAYEVEELRKRWASAEW